MFEQSVKPRKSLARTRQTKICELKLFFFSFILIGTFPKGLTVVSVCVCGGGGWGVVDEYTEKLTLEAVCVCVYK